MLLLLLFEEVVSEMAVRPGMPGPVAVGHIRPPEPRSTLAHGPPAICDDADPTLPTPEIDIVGRREPTGSKNTAVSESSLLHISTATLLTSGDMNSGEFYAVRLPIQIKLGEKSFSKIIDTKHFRFPLMPDVTYGRFTPDELSCIKNTRVRWVAYSQPEMQNRFRVAMTSQLAADDRRIPERRYTNGSG